MTHWTWLQGQEWTKPEAKLTEAAARVGAVAPPPPLARHGDEVLAAAWDVGQFHGPMCVMNPLHITTDYATPHVGTQLYY